MARRIAISGALVVAALTVAAVALAYSEFRYSSVYLSGPGATYQTGFAPRQYAYACRERSSNYGLAADAITTPIS